MAETLDEKSLDENGIGEVRWAAPVRQDLLRRLYETDAQGLADAALTDDVGLALYLRCRSIAAVMDAAAGRVACPRCARRGERNVILRAVRDLSAAGKAEVLRCAVCGWWTTWGQFWETYRNRQLYGAGGMEAFHTFLASYDGARTVREKLHAIDRLIHSFHYNLQKGAKEPVPSRPAAANVVEGSLGEVVAFLDRLSHGENATAEMRETRAAYEEQMPRTWAGARYSRSE